MRFYIYEKGASAKTEVTLLKFLSTIYAKKDRVFDAQIGFVDGSLEITLFKFNLC